MKVQFPRLTNAAKPWSCKGTRKPKQDQIINKFAFVWNHKINVRDRIRTINNMHSHLFKTTKWMHVTTPGKTNSSFLRKIVLILLLLLPYLATLHYGKYLLGKLLILVTPSNLDFKYLPPMMSTSLLKACQNQLQSLKQRHPWYSVVSEETTNFHFDIHAAQLGHFNTIAFHDILSMTESLESQRFMRPETCTLKLSLTFCLSLLMFLPLTLWCFQLTVLWISFPDWDFLTEKWAR